jgi:hypothetical protein
VDTKDLFALALGLTKPWYVTRNELDTVKRQLEIGIDFERGGTFPWPEFRASIASGVASGRSTCRGLGPEAASRSCSKLC